MTGRLVTTMVAAGTALAVLAPSAGAAVNFEAPLTFTATAPNSIAVGDFNGDGNQDVAAATTSPPAVKVLLGTGSGNFTDGPVVNVSGPDPVTSIAVGDLDHNGRDDLVITRSGADRPHRVVPLERENGFDPGSDAPVANDPRDIALGRFDADGNLDAAVAAGNSNAVSIRLGNGTGFAAAGPRSRPSGGTPHGRWPPATSPATAPSTS